jgi:hypothetical protein
MVDIAYSVGTYLQGAGFGTLGTDIFVDNIPPDLNGLWISYAGGQPNKYCPIEETVLDIYCKNIKSELCISKLRSIIDNIHRQHTQTINDSFIYTILVIGGLQVVDEDDEHSKIYKITVQLLDRDTILIS